MVQQDFSSCQGQFHRIIFHPIRAVTRTADHRVVPPKRMDEIVRVIGQGILQIVGVVVALVEEGHLDRGRW